MSVYKQITKMRAGPDRSFRQRPASAEHPLRGPGWHAGPLGRVRINPRVFLMRCATGELRGQLIHERLMRRINADFNQQS